jgi:hypothetical protein
MEDRLLWLAFRWGLPLGLIMALVAVGKPHDIVGWVGAAVGAAAALAIHDVAKELERELD